MLWHAVQQNMQHTAGNGMCYAIYAVLCHAMLYSKSCGLIRHFDALWYTCYAILSHGMI